MPRKRSMPPAPGVLTWARAAAASREASVRATSGRFMAGPAIQRAAEGRLAAAHGRNDSNFIVVVQEGGFRGVLLIDGEHGVGGDDEAGDLGEEVGADGGDGGA